MIEAKPTNFAYRAVMGLGWLYKSVTIIFLALAFIVGGGGILNSIRERLARFRPKTRELEWKKPKMQETSGYRQPNTRGKQSMKV